MEKLVIIKNGLIPVMENDKKEKLVDARMLHDFLEVGRDFTSWIKGRIKKYGFIENIDYIVFTKTGENLLGGRPTTEYVLTLDVAKELSMVENNEKGREARLYFIGCEKKLKEVTKDFSSKLPKSFGEALRMLADTVDKNERLQIENKKLTDEVIELEPKADYHDKVISSPNGLTTTQIAKELGLPSATFLNRLLSDSDIQYKHRGQWELYSQYMGNDYTVPYTYVNSRGYTYHQMNWTEKGKKFIFEILKDKLNFN